VDSKHHPISRLLSDHLAQGVWKWCVCPGWKHDYQQLPTGFGPLAEDIEGTPSEDDETQGRALVHRAAPLTAKRRRLGLDSRGGLDEVTRACAQINHGGMGT
jgi:hypothetical protein